MRPNGRPIRQVLIINVTRMGDLVQTGPLITRLQEESPGVAVDLVVDSAFGPTAAMLPGVRDVLTYDFQRLIDESRTMSRDVVDLYRDMAAWAAPLAQRRYDRIVNLTFTQRSGLLAAYIGAPDMRGVTVGTDGAPTVRDPWLTYFTDLHLYRRFNRFNLVDLYALGGSGTGPHAPLALKPDREANEWAGTFLRASGAQDTLVAVQVGASEAIKAWRPEYFGRAMAAIGRRAPVTFVLIGTKGEAIAVQDALAAYRAMDGRGAVCLAVGRTTLPQLTALLSQCRLLLTNDTGPMHLAVSVGTPVIDLSVGHVDFRETGPYGAGHWVIQPELECAPCGFDHICPHHACKDRVDVEQVAALCLHALGRGAFLPHVSGVRIYASGVDEDGLGCYHLRAGREDARAGYGAFWRRFWYESLTGRPSRVPETEDVSFAEDVGGVFDQLRPRLDRVVTQAERLVRLSRQSPAPVAALRAAQDVLANERQRAVACSMDSPAFSPLAAAFLRETRNIDAPGLVPMAQQQLNAYRTWKARANEVMGRLSCIAGGRRMASA